MPSLRSRATRLSVPLLLVLLLGACTAAGRPGAEAPDPADAGPGASMVVPTWPDASQAPGWSAGPGDASPEPPTTPTTQAPDASPASPGGSAAGGSAGSAATDPTIVSLSSQADRAIQQLAGALSDDAANPTDDGGLP